MNNSLQIEKVSVCIATFNGEKFISSQLASILNQLRPIDEIIISDDSSTDKTLEIIYTFNDNRIRVYPNQKFGNPIFNFENAMQKSCGDIIFLADQDDEWVEGKVETVLRALEDFDMVVTDHSVINEVGEIILDSYFSKVYSRPGIIKNLKKNTYYGCCMAFKRVILNYALPFPKKIPMHDIWLGFVADIFFKVKFINYPYTKYRKHSNNVSIASELNSSNSIEKKILYRLNVIRYLPNLINRNYKIRQ